MQLRPLAGDYDTHPPDRLLDQEPIARQPLLLRAFANALAMIRVGEQDQPIDLGQDIRLFRNRPLLLGLNGRVFLLAAYWWRP